METGQIAYESFARQKGYAMTWRNLPEAEKDIWREVARSVFRKGWQERLPFALPVPQSLDELQHERVSPQPSPAYGPAAGVIPAPALVQRDLLRTGQLAFCHFLTACHQGDSSGPHAVFPQDKVIFCPGVTW